jgi:HK97 family phage prohead protease
MMTPNSAPDRERVVSEAHAASAALSRMGDSLVTGPASYEAEPSDEERSLVVTLSTAGRDRQGDVLEPEGAELENFRRNPVVLFAHRHDLPAVGKVLWVRALPGRLVAKIAFARTQLGEELYLLYSRGYMKAWSVGFLPVEWERIPGRRSGVRVTRWELLEVSAVPVPANPEALSKAVRSGEVREPELLSALRPAGGDPPAAPGAPAEKEPEPRGSDSAGLAELAEKASALERRLSESEQALARLALRGEAKEESAPARVIEAVARAAGAAVARKLRALLGRLEHGASGGRSRGAERARTD